MPKTTPNSLAYNSVILIFCALLWYPIMLILAKGLKVTGYWLDTFPMSERMNEIVADLYLFAAIFGVPMIAGLLSILLFMALTGRLFLMSESSSSSRP